MEPSEAANIMRDEAHEIMQMIRNMRSRTSSEFSQKDLITWLCHALQQHADFKLDMAEVFSTISAICPDLILSSHPTSTVYETSDDEIDDIDTFEYDAPEEINVKNPPFDASFWENLGDIL